MSLQTDLNYSAQVVRQVSAVESDWPWLRWAYVAAVLVGVCFPFDQLREWMQ